MLFEGFLCGLTSSQDPQGSLKDPQGSPRGLQKLQEARGEPWRPKPSTKTQNQKTNKSQNWLKRSPSDLFNNCWVFVVWGGFLDGLTSSNFVASFWVVLLFEGFLDGLTSSQDPQGSPRGLQGSPRASWSLRRPLREPWGSLGEPWGSLEEVKPLRVCVFCVFSMV